MQQELPRHEKIRFRRGEIADLASFPSAAATAEPPRSRKPRRALKVLGAAAAGVFLLLILAIAGLHVVGLSGIGSDRLRATAENALKEMAGVEGIVTMGPSRIKLDGMRFLALEVQGVSIRQRDGDMEVIRAGSVRFGARLLPLLFGDVKISSVRLSDARILAGVLSGDTDRDWTEGFRNQRGLIDPDLVAEAVFASTHRMLDVIGSRALTRVALDNVELVLPAGEGPQHVKVVRSRLTDSPGDSLSFTSQLEIDGRAIALSLSAARDSSTGRVSLIDLAASSPEPENTTAANRIGSVDLKIKGMEGAEGGRGRIEASLKVADWVVDLGARGAVSGDLDIEGGVLLGNSRVDIRRLSAVVGRSQFEFVGAMGPRPRMPEAEEDRAAYRFDLVSARSTIAPDGSPEPAMNAGLRLGGIYLPESRSLTADRIVVTSGRAEALGTATLQLEEGLTPGLLVAFNVHDMPVSQVKQLWPWFSARPARKWVLNNVFGGVVSEGQLKVEVPPGRLGDGVPLTGEESFGSFSLERTRFDTTGLMPPVRDATGVVDYRGADVDIRLASGTAYLPSGRTVAASDGTLTIRKGNVPPVIGSLDIDVAGEAPAVAEFASYEPINALRYMKLSPDDFTSGQVSGNVKADIPLQKGIDRERLGWLVSLNYENLSIARQIDGQDISEAKGTIVVDKASAVVKADAKLNGIEADLDIVEPLGGSDVGRKRLVTVTLDQKTREEVVPGLSGLVEGPVKVAIDAREGGQRRVEADLTGARLILPWVGWSKGAGIGGSVSFLMENRDGRTTLSDFDLRGDTFGMAGEVALVDGGLSEARLSRVKLNRNDDVAVTVRRDGRDYAVSVSGKSLDARAMIKQFTSDSGTPAKKAASGSVSLNVDVATVSGFHNENLAGVKLEYRGSGTRTDKLDVTANVASGTAVELRSGGTGNGRALRLTSADAGAVLRFMDLYEYMEGGRINVDLKGTADGPMTGHVDASDFVVVDDPRLRSIVSTTPPGGERSLNQAVRGDIDTSRVHFERCYSRIEKGAGYLRLSDGVLRGTAVGASFQGMLYDQQGNMNMTGTFMPAYGLNRIFGEIPIIGVLLGNGRDRGLIGVTFRLEGDADKPNVQINPLSVVAPGIFRSIFEFR